MVSLIKPMLPCNNPMRNKIAQVALDLNYSPSRVLGCAVALMKMQGNESERQLAEEVDRTVEAYLKRWNLGAK